jgi:hypothetical protein
MENVDFVTHLSEMYKITFSEHERDSLNEFIKSSDIGNAPFTLRPISSKEDLFNKVHITSTLSNSIEDIHLEELVYAVKPFVAPVNFEYETTRQNDNVITTGYMPDDCLDWNLFIVRVTNYNDKTKCFEREYEIYIYNPKLEVVGGGIMFEDI